MSSQCGLVPDNPPNLPCPTVIMPGYDGSPYVPELPKTIYQKIRSLPHKYRLAGLIITIIKNTTLSNPQSATKIYNKMVSLYVANKKMLKLVPSLSILSLSLVKQILKNGKLEGRFLENQYSKWALRKDMALVNYVNKVFVPITDEIVPIPSCATTTTSNYNGVFRGFESTSTCNAGTDTSIRYTISTGNENPLRFYGYLP